MVRLTPPGKLMMLGCDETGEKGIDVTMMGRPPSTMGFIGDKSRGLLLAVLSFTSGVPDRTGGVTPGLLLAVGASWLVEFIPVQVLQQRIETVENKTKK
jgi:hypothetical protein